MSDNNEKKRILFVDDEQKVLDGLRRSLFLMNTDWHMEFVTSGKEGLALMKDAPFDIIMSDMRMPNMDGAELLSKVKELYPDTIRFILSGNSDREMIMRTVGPCDQFLTKPCDADLLQEIISKALESRNFIDHNELKSIVAKMDRLPTLPKLYTELTEILESEESSFDDIANVVKKDVTVCAKVLQLVNSAFFGLRHEVNDIKRALTYLGIETLKSIIITADLFTKFTKEEIALFSINAIYDHSVRVQLIASKILLLVTGDKELADKAILAGMLHDIGKLILIRNKANEYKEIFQKICDGDEHSLCDLEKEYINITHAEIGSYLMGIWGLSDDIVDAISYHHNPIKSLDLSFNISSAVYIANLLDHEQGDEHMPKNGFSNLDLSCLTKMNLIKYLPEWKKIADMAKRAI